MVKELRHRDPLLFWTGAAMLLAFVVCALVSIGDQRLIFGINPWIKPMKFMSSVTIYMWTIAWFMPEARPGAMRTFVSRTISLTMILEIVLIVTQSARGVGSHFNNATGFDAAVFGIMGLTILVNTIAVMIFLAILRRDTPASRAGYIWGIRLGLILFLLASAEGGIIISNNAHTVGAPDGGPGLPFVNWSTSAGDLRIAHFFGMHALQALPLLGFFLDQVNSKAARNVVVATSILWVAIMGGLLMMALNGRPLVAF